MGCFVALGCLHLDTDYVSDFNEVRAGANTDYVSDFNEVRAGNDA